jgi:hypothetical protein
MNIADMLTHDDQMTRLAARDCVLIRSASRSGLGLIFALLVACHSFFQSIGEVLHIAFAHSYLCSGDLHYTQRDLERDIP